MQLNPWAAKHGVSTTALDELKAILSGDVETTGQPSGGEGSESRIQTEVRLEASKKQCRLWRNNVGALPNPLTGQLVRYGLCNESTKMNRTFKSSDLIGIRPVAITPDHVGCTFGQFVAREIKASDWSYTGKGREVAQMRFIQLVNGLGGDACFANNAKTL